MALTEWSRWGRRSIFRAVVMAVALAWPCPCPCLCPCPYTRPGRGPSCGFGRFRDRCVRGHVPDRAEPLGSQEHLSHCGHGRGFGRARGRRGRSFWLLCFCPTLFTPPYSSPNHASTKPQLAPFPSCSSIPLLCRQAVAASVVVVLAMTVAVGVVIASVAVVVTVASSLVVLVAVAFVLLLTDWRG